MRAHGRLAFTCVAVILATVCCSTGFADAQRVVKRTRLGNQTEGITYYHKGKQKNVVIVDGYDVLAVRLDRSVPKKTKQLFSSQSLGTIPPRGIAYVPSQDRSTSAL